MFLNLLLGIIGAYLTYVVGYQFFFSVAGLFPSRKRKVITTRQRRFVVLIPAYREDRVIANTAQAALLQNYPPHLFEIVVIADSLQAETLATLHQLPIQVVEVTFEQSTKSKSLNHTLKLLSNNYDAVVILDADNVMEVNFLQQMNDAMNRGYRAVQGRRVAKNLDTPIAILDGASEDINNQIYGSGQRNLGFSARLAGSGMAFEYALFKEIMTTVDAIGGFDKELELKLTQRRITIGYQPEAQVYDEKVRQGGNFAKQRGRWIAAQFYYAQQFLPTAFMNLIRSGNLDFFNKAMQMILLPRLFTPALLAFGTFIGLIFNAQLALFCGGLLIANILAFVLAFPAYLFQKPYRSALLSIPFALWLQVKSMRYWRQARKRFLHTSHDFIINTHQTK